MSEPSDVPKPVPPPAPPAQKVGVLSEDLYEAWDLRRVAHEFRRSYKHTQHLFQKYQKESEGVMWDTDEEGRIIKRIRRYLVLEVQNERSARLGAKKRRATAQAMKTIKEKYG